MTNTPWDERMQHAIGEVQDVSKAAFPEGAFQVHCGDDPAGIDIDASTKAEHGCDGLDVVGDRLVDCCVEAGLGLSVVPLLKAEPDRGLRITSWVKGVGECGPFQD
jgi:hypothetical protein